LDVARGIAEIPVTMATGAASATAGGIGGLIAAILSNDKEKVAQVAAQALQSGTYVPRSVFGRAALEKIGQVAGALPPVIGAGAPGALTPSVAAVRPVIETAAQRAAAGLQSGARAVPRAMFPEVGPTTTLPQNVRSVGGSAGAAATPLEIQRAAEAEAAGLRLSEGEIKRDPGILSWEKEKAKTPEYQQQFVERQLENNRAAISNLEQVLDDTGAATRELGDTGVAVVDALMRGWRGEKAKTSAMYNAFRQSKEASMPVDITPLTSMLSEQPVGVAGITGVTDTARQNIVRLGLASVDENGALVPNPRATLGQLEDLRQAVSATGASSSNDKRLISMLKRTIDNVGNPVGGDMTRAMRAQRTKQAIKYENRAIVSRLLLEKKGMSDPQVPIEDVFQKTIISARPSEITHIKRVLSTIPASDAVRM
jgi:hypothetical protein